ncbi:MAG: (2Fe-2S)-binding protein [Chitinophagaceae bacterium]|nr:(2Fe-2S)-binding protein [Rubrivivax sp.]
MNSTPIDTPSRRLTVQVNGITLVRQVECRKHLVDFLREDCGLKGSHLGCEHGVCGACTVRLDGKVVRGCLVLAAQADGCQVETVETPAPSRRLKALQNAFIEHNALQCGYCTPGMLMAALDLVERQPHADRKAVREWMSGNYCRCTGYHAIVDAVCAVLEQQRAGRLSDDQAGEAVALTGTPA